MDSYPNMDAYNKLWTAFRNSCSLPLDGESEHRLRLLSAPIDQVAKILAEFPPAFIYLNSYTLDALVEDKDLAEKMGVHQKVAFGLKALFTAELDSRC